MFPRSLTFAGHVVTRWTSDARASIETRRCHGRGVHLISIMSTCSIEGISGCDPGDTWTIGERPIFLGRSHFIAISKKKYGTTRGLIRAGDRDQTATMHPDLPIIVATCGAFWSVGSSSNGRRKGIKASLKREIGTAQPTRSNRTVDGRESRTTIDERTWRDRGPIVEQSWLL